MPFAWLLRPFFGIFHFAERSDDGRKIQEERFSRTRTRMFFQLELPFDDAGKRLCFSTSVSEPAIVKPDKALEPISYSRWRSIMAVTKGRTVR